MRGDDAIESRHATMKMTTTTQATGKVCEGSVRFGCRSDADIAGGATIATARASCAPLPLPFPCAHKVGAQMDGITVGGRDFSVLLRLKKT